MTEYNTMLFEKHKDILSFRDLAPKTISTYVSYLTAYIRWVETELPGRDLCSITWEEIRSYIRFLKDVRELNPRTINVHEDGSSAVDPRYVHVCLSGGGLRPDNTFGETSHKHFIIPKPVIASYFRGRFLCSVKKLHDDRDHPLSIPENLKDPDNRKAYIDLLLTKKWLPFVKETFNGNGNAIQYLGRYSYRTAISNSRITSVDEDTVSFRYKDYADGNAPKILTVKGTEFIDLFLRHVLPKGFSRIRYAGILTNSRKTKNLKHIHQLRNTVYQVSPCKDMKVRELVLHLFNRDIEKCSCCGGHLIVIYRNRGRPKNMEPSLPSTPSAAMC